MFSFEGDFKTRPKVSLGGASRKVRDAACLSPVFTSASLFLRRYFYRWAFKKKKKMGTAMTKVYHGAEILSS